ncbi:MAG: SH3 domain-containing protein [Leptospiraceae bacterium]|nr:SH3 domain-containing protein [Leptospiraceae bacterium]
MKKIIFFVAALSVFSVFAESSFQPGKIKVTARSLIVRNIASQGGTEVTQVKRGDILNAVERSINESTIEEFTDYWYKINLPKNKTGWVFGAYITFDVNLESGLRWKNQNPGQGNKFTGINIAPNGNIFLGTESGVLFLSNDKGKSWRKIVPQVLGINLATINKITSDEKAIWIAGSGDTKGGVWKTSNNGNSWTQFTTSQGLPSNEIYDIAISPNVIYAATRGGIAISKDQGLTWAIMEGEFKERVFSTATSQDGKVFIGTNKGLYVFSESKGLFGGTKKLWKRLGENAPNMGEQIYSIAISPNGDIYIGSENGLSKSNITNLDTWSGIGGKTNVNSILIGQSGKIIIGTDNGLNISLDNGISWVTYKKENGLAGNRINQVSIHPTEKNIWAIGLDGVSFHE